MSKKMAAEELAKVVATLLNYEPRLADSNYAAVISELSDALNIAVKEAREEGFKEGRRDMDRVPQGGAIVNDEIICPICKAFLTLP